MKALKEFSLPISGLITGVHAYQFELDQSFFKAFDNKLTENGLLKADVELDKKPGMLVFDMNVNGQVATTCDRCLAPIQLPVQGSYQLIVKYSDQPREEGEVVYISPEETTFDLSSYLHELVALSMPFSKVYDCEEDDPIPCDLETLDRLETDQEEEKESDSGTWDALKDIELN